MKPGKNVPGAGGRIVLPSRRQARLPRACPGVTSVQQRTHQPDPHTSYPVSDIAHGQLAGYLGIPKGFYDRLWGANESLRLLWPDALEGTEALPSIPSPALFDLTVYPLLREQGEDSKR